MRSFSEGASKGSANQEGVSLYPKSCALTPSPPRATRGRWPAGGQWATLANTSAAAPYVHVSPILPTYRKMSPVTLMSPEASKSRRCHQLGLLCLGPGGLRAAGDGAEFVQHIEVQDLEIRKGRIRAEASGHLAVQVVLGGLPAGEDVESPNR